MARLAIDDLQWHHVMQEHFPAQPGYTLDVCRKTLEACDLVLLIVAWRQGWVPTLEQGGNGRDSITSLEVAHADSKGIPIIALVANDDWPGKFWESDENKQHWVRDFRSNLNRVAQFFEPEKAENLPNFRALVKQNLLSYKESLLRETPPGQDAGRATVDSKIIGRARAELADGTRTPVLGCGIYGTGPLSSRALVRALIDEGESDAGDRERTPLATAAEYYERTLSRIEFLEDFSEIIREQSAQAAVPRILDLVAGLDRVKTIVSATYDSAIEDKLKSIGRPFALVSHVLRLHGEKSDSPEAPGKQDQPEEGEVVILRPGKPPEFNWADGFSIDPDECIVYKPQGSADLIAIQDSELKVDTGVITERDYATFLRHLGSRQRGVPASVIARLRNSPLVFLGYTMDVWQYRLITLLFQSARRQDRRTLAVRIPDNEMEKAAWGGLDALLIEMDPNQFALGASAGTVSGR